MAIPSRPLRIVNAVAPIRICDNGGWTDTWFAGHGKIFNIGVYPYAEVQIQVYPYDKGAGWGPSQDDRVVIHAENYGDHYVRDLSMSGWQKHPLLEAAIHRMKVPEDMAIHLTIFSEAPGGASTGTSAAVTVALVGALDRLTQGRMTPHEVAYTAWAIETEELGQQSGIQDQLASAYGGINFIEMFQYPTASVSPIQVSNTVWWELERRLTLIFLGKSHASSDVHQKVIRELEGEGPDSPRLEALRSTAARSRDAVYVGDWASLGQAMADNTEAQARLHPELVSQDAWKIIRIAKEHGALGWKVNGAGGDGGSVAILCGELSSTKRTMIREMEQENEAWRHIPVYLSRQGLRTWEEEGGC